MKIYFARHGEYQNPKGVVPYRLPGFSLTDLGRAQAQFQADKLAAANLRDIFTSPIERCIETATIIGKSLSLHPNQKDEIIETSTPLQGMTKEAPSLLSPNYPYDIPSHQAGGGESPENIFKRMSDFIDKLKLMSKNSSHLIVSHGDPITIFLIATLTNNIPHTIEEFENTKIRYIPMGGLAMLDYNQKGIPKYTEII